MTVFDKLKSMLLLGAVLAPVAANAQFVNIDWMPNDTVLPYYAESFDVGKDYKCNAYDFAMEYIETVPATKAELQRYGVSADEVSDKFKVETFMGVSRGKGRFDVSVCPLAKKDGRIVKLISFKPVVKAVPNAEVRTRAAEGAERYAEQSLLATGKWVKIRVQSEGVYELTKSALSSMGFSNPDKVRLYGYNVPVLREGNIELIPDDMQEIPLWRKQNGGLLFYSCGTVRWTRKNYTSLDFSHFNNPYSTHVCYFVTDSPEGEPAKFVQQDETPAVPSEVTTFAEHKVMEADEFSFINSGRTFFEAYDYANGNKKTYNLSLPGLATGDVSLTVQFAAAGPASSSLTVSAGTKDLGTMTFSALTDYIYARVNSRSYKVQGVNGGNLPVTLTHTRTQGVSGHLDYIRASYERNLDMSGLSALPFTPLNNTANVYVIAGASESTRVWRVTSPETTCELKGDLSEGIYKVGAKLSAGRVNQHRYVAVDVNSSYPAPEVVGQISNQDLHSTAPADLVIIVPANGKLTAQAQRLADAHTAREGMRCFVVSADKIYNEFSSGTPDATAYRRFMKMLYDRAENEEDAPKNLLLFGDCIWDNRAVTSKMKGRSPEDYLLCYESDNSVSHTDSYVLEEYFTLLDDGEGVRPLKEKTDIGVGRIPVTNATDAKTVVDKLIRYINNEEVGAWKNTICILGDDGDKNQHMDDAEDVLQSTEALFPEYRYRRIYWDAYTIENTSTGANFPGAYSDINKQMDDGALIMNYTGHGAAYSLSHEKTIRRTDFERWNSPRLPLWITAACDISPFDMSEENIGETALLNAKGAAMGMITTSRTVYSSQNRKINKYFMKHVLGRNSNGKRVTIGEALHLAKNDVVAGTVSSRDSLNKCHFVLLGDPAITLATPTYTAKVDEFNGKSAGEDADVTISAGNVVKVKGYIVDEEGNVATNFNGIVSPTVFDNIEKVICKNGAGEDVEEPMSYYERLKTIYAGSDSVRNGYFEFSFPVPLDINYSDESGLLKLYAVNSEQTLEANGDYDDFLVGGTNPSLNTDSLGPEISLYLNYDSFENGNRTNDTPVLVAEIFDMDGINTTGSGVGHDVMAIIDNDESMSYSLNSYFVQQPGDYTRGTVVFRIPTLPEGRHTLLLRAWDVMNNPSSKTIEFEVVKGLAPSMFELSCQGPVRSSATFKVVTDRPHSQMDLRLVVYDMAGREVAHLDNQSGDSKTNLYTFTWDLSSGGKRILPGVYICRAILTDDSGASSSKALKFVVLGTGKSE